MLYEHLVQRKFLPEISHLRYSIFEIDINYFSSHHSSFACFIPPSVHLVITIGFSLLSYTVQEYARTLNLIVAITDGLLASEDEVAVTMMTIDGSAVGKT